MTAQDQIMWTGYNYWVTTSEFQKYQQRVKYPGMEAERPGYYLIPAVDANGRVTTSKEGLVWWLSNYEPILTALNISKEDISSYTYDELKFVAEVAMSGGGDKAKAIIDEFAVSNPSSAALKAVMEALRFQWVQQQVAPPQMKVLGEEYWGPIKEAQAKRQLRGFGPGGWRWGGVGGDAEPTIAQARLVRRY